MFIKPTQNPTFPVNQEIVEMIKLHNYTPTFNIFSRLVNAYNIDFEKVDIVIEMLDLARLKKYLAKYRHSHQCDRRCQCINIGKRMTTKIEFLSQRYTISSNALDSVLDEISLIKLTLSYL